ncbi:MAG: hypothetical protein R2818_07755 [Flavobacteriales bacterium]
MNSELYRVDERIKKEDVEMVASLNDEPELKNTGACCSSLTANRGSYDRAELPLRVGQLPAGITAVPATSRRSLSSAPARPP